MYQEQVTLKALADTLGVSTTTIHRALSGKPGISEETSRRIKQVAGELGYKGNYMAAALKRKEIRIAIALPEPYGESRFFYSRMWSGVRQFFSEVSEFNISALEYMYKFENGAHGEALSAILDDNERVDGLLTMGVAQGQSSSNIRRFNNLGIPIVLIGNEMYEDMRLCCVRACDEMVGALAAELLIAFNSDRSPKTVIVAGHTGPFGMADQHRNAMGFDSHMRSDAPNITSIHINNDSSSGWAVDMERALSSEKNVFAIYSCSARFTVYLVELLRELNLTGKIFAIGNDLFDESISFLRNGELNAVIDKKIARQSHLAMKILFDYVVRNEPPKSGQLQIRPEVILRKSVDFSLGKSILPSNQDFNKSYQFDDIISP